MPAELLRRAAAATPDGVAITVVDGDRLTYADWVGRSAAQARGLARAGIGASDAVALLFEARQWTDYAVAYVAVHSAGAIPVPLSRDLSAVEISRAVRLSGTVAIVAAADA
ncbi:MAG TPA: AMP-binding protein, partial [Candidatus Dormibacteraeota bacterium]|nr:AMP-binding protein [Candidatus Dormibacteraeota bacterium]